MSQNSTTTLDGVRHSKPIPISTEHLRHRSTSFSSDLSNSPNSSPPLSTPKNIPSSQVPVSSSSPILYFLSQSPTKGSATFPFRGFAPPPLLEDDSVEESGVHAHLRRASTTARFQPPPFTPEPQHERGVNVLRRLSLGGPRPKPPTADIPHPATPTAPPNSAVSGPIIQNGFSTNRKPRRSATVTETARPRRAPSPMGERILKGHFDGFN